MKEIEAMIERIKQLLADDGTIYVDFTVEKSGRKIKYTIKGRITK